MATNSDHLQEVFGQIDLLYKHIGNNRHAPAVAVEGAVIMGNASGAYSPTNRLPANVDGSTVNFAVDGIAVSPTNRLPVQLLLSPQPAAVLFTIADGSHQQTPAGAENLLPAGTVGIRIQKSAGVGVRFRLAASNAAPLANTAGNLMLPDITGFVDIPAAPGQIVQVIRMAGDTGTGLFAYTPLFGA